jgi:hypothetical protein
MEIYICSNYYSLNPWYVIYLVVWFDHVKYIVAKLTQHLATLSKSLDNLV